MISSSPSSAQDFSLVTSLDAGWEMLSTGVPQTPETIEPSLFAPARVPGTVASSLRERGLWRMGAGAGFDSSEHWFRCRFESSPAEFGEEIVLRFGGIATLAEVWLNGEKILTSDSMFSKHTADVTKLVEYRNELLIVCRSLTSAVREKRRQQPLARWKTRVVAEQQLRWFRTTLLGRAPGFAREPEPVGPWRPITLERRRQLTLENWMRTASLDGSTGVLDVRLTLRPLDSRAIPVAGKLVAGNTSVAFNLEESGDRCDARASLRMQNVKPWTPHTHGSPNLYSVHAEFELKDGSEIVFEDIPVGFRSLESDAAGDEGLALKINGTPIFCRGVVWTPPDAVSLAASPAEVRERLELLRDAGFNLIRLAGTTVYEDEKFHSLCDELGLLVWQDMMFANMDYPYGNTGFRDLVRAEAEAELSRIGRHASLAVICGNSEIEQQAGMLGLPPEIAQGSWFGRDLPEIAEKYCPGVPYVPSAPSGGDLPFRTRSGIANYFGVGAYLRPLEDVRRAEVRFASECLAFANIPESELIDKMALAIPGGISPTHPAWKRGVPRDSGASWDFEDVRDHYFKSLFAIDAAALRSTDCHRYWELSRMVSGEVMAEVFGEWRRPQSPCSGGIVLWAADLEPGAGWGILDSRGHPKSAYWFLKRALSPRAIWTTDEGLNGIDVHVANDAPEPMNCRLRVALYRGGEQRIAQSEIPISVPMHAAETFGVEQILGHFVDAAYAYRFGPAGHDLVVCSLHESAGDVPFAQAFRFPAGYPTSRAPISELGIHAEARRLSHGAIELVLTARHLAWGVRISASGLVAADAYFHLEPGVGRRIILRPMHAVEPPVSLGIEAINADGRQSVTVEGLP